MENNNNIDLFIKDLENKIVLDEKRLEEIEAQKQNILGLIEYIKSLQVLLMNDKDDKRAIVRCDIGDGIFMNGKLNKNNKKILINVGSDVYVDLTYAEAIDNLLTQQKLIDKKIIVLKKELVKNKSYIKLTKGINETLVKHQMLEGNMLKKENNQDNNNFNI